MVFLVKFLFLQLWVLPLEFPLHHTGLDTGLDTGLNIVVAYYLLKKNYVLSLLSFGESFGAFVGAFVSFGAFVGAFAPFVAFAIVHFVVYTLLIMPDQFGFGSVFDSLP